MSLSVQNKGSMNALRHFHCPLAAAVEWTGGHQNLHSKYTQHFLCKGTHCGPMVARDDMREFGCVRQHHPSEFESLPRHTLKLSYIGLW